MTTMLDVVSRSLRMLGVYAPGDAIPSAEAQDALAVANRILTDWNLEDLLVYTIDRTVFPVTAFTQTYTIGPTGVWVLARPNRIEQINWQYTGTEINIPLRPLRDQEYQGLLVRNVTGAIAISFYYHETYPDGEVFLWPIPTTAGNAVVFSKHPWSGTAVLTTVLSLPPGYQAAFEYGLAVELYPEYPRPSGLNPEIRRLARETKDNIKIINESPPLMRSDAAHLTGGPHQRGGLYTGWARWLAGDDGR